MTAKGRHCWGVRIRNGLTGTAGECRVVKYNLIIKYGKEIVYGLLKSKR